jgi:hypothetical protein
MWENWSIKSILNNLSDNTEKSGLCFKPLFLCFIVTTDQRKERPVGSVERNNGNKLEKVLD